MGFRTTLVFESTVTLVPFSLLASELSFASEEKKNKVWYNMQYMSYNHLTDFLSTKLPAQYR